MAVLHSVLQLESDVREEGLVLADSLQLGAEGETVGESLTDVPTEWQLAEILAEAVQLQDLGELTQLVQVGGVEAELPRVEIAEDSLQGGHSDQPPALEDGLEAGGGGAVLVLRQALLQVDAEEGAVSHLSEHAGPESDQAGSSLSRLDLAGLPHQTLRVFPQGGARGQE